MASRYHVLYLAKLAQQAERYDDMVDAMKKLAANFNVEFDVEERNLLSIAYKHVIDARRESWKTLSSIELPKEEFKYNNEINVIRVRDYCNKIGTEIIDICKDAIQLIDDYLLPFSSHVENSAYYCKMKADFYRYQAEIFPDDNEKNLVVGQSMEAYEEGTAIAMAKLPATNPVRLGLALNFAVFYYEIMSLPERASNMAKEALEESILELGTISDSSYLKNENYYNESKIVMQLLRNNLTLWDSD